MTQQELIQHLQDNGCLLVRMSPQGYAVMRNPITGQMTGVPIPTRGKDGHYLLPTICHICRNVGTEIPDCAKEAVGIIDHVRSQHIDKLKEN